MLKLDPGGWDRSWGRWTWVAAQSVIVDAAVAVLMCGSFKGSIDFGSGPMDSAGGLDIFVAKLHLP